MKPLWTPWRMEHVLGQAPALERCLFEPPGSEPHAAEQLLLYRDSTVLCLLNRYPYANGHLLVAPIRHVDCITELESGEMQELMALVQQATAIIKRLLKPDGCNIGLNIGSVAGAGIDDHLHVHIVPRWQDDHNFIAVLAEIKAIPQHITTTFELLLPEFKALYRSRQATFKTSP